MSLTNDFVNVAAGLLFKDSKVLVARRKEGCWEFPGGKLEADESYEHALQREFREELGIDIMPVQELAGVEVEKDKTILIIMFILVTGDISKIRLTVHTEYKMVGFDDLYSLDMCPADRKMIDENKDALKEFLS